MAVRKRIGHASIRVALVTYSQAIPEMQKDAIARIDAGRWVPLT